ncbi:two-component response regulator [Clostridium bornimense]|uniref:Stage 0 sporulation protein A homolog n=2 Tax=Clostridium bornimense TaxID=1216932 RepID=W6SK58_9CLOT|nr:two-component response regulator [Clostridium bornimense]
MFIVKFIWGGKMRILLIEDDETLSMGIEYSLKNEGYEVSIANNIEEGRKATSNEIFDLILLDVTLPDGNGYDFCREIRNNSDIPIIFLTACDEEVNIVLGLDLGADDYLTKPIRVRELIARINAVFRRKNVKRDISDKIIYKDLTILPLKYEVYKDRNKVQLTSVEYKLMLMMIENKGNVLTRKQLLEKLWDVEGNFVEEKTLNVYIKRLREKLGEDDSIAYIETVRGIGYRWIGDDN